MTCSINKSFQLISLQPTPCKKDSNVSCVYCPNGVTNSLTCIRTNKKQTNSFSPSPSPLNKKGKEKEAHPYVQTRPKALFSFCLVWSCWRCPCRQFPSIHQARSVIYSFSIVMFLQLHLATHSLAIAFCLLHLVKEVIQLIRLVRNGV